MNTGKSLPRVLVVHNRYRAAGGEDQVFENEVGLLRSAGCEVETLEVSNRDVHGLAGTAGMALGTIYSRTGRSLVARAIERFGPGVVHVHNFFPQISPAMFDACAAAGVPVVWTMHNFRVTCANGLLFRDGKPCETCVGKSPMPAILHRCYRDSAMASTAVAGMIAYHRARGTWHDKVTRFIALSEFAKDILMRAGLPGERISVKGNFVFDPLSELGSAVPARSGALYVGRISTEKGVATLIEAWRSLPGIPLTIIGDGPLRTELERIAPPHVAFLGFQPRDVVLLHMAAAAALVVPSVCYENYPMTMAEGMALGTPIIASRLGALATLVEDGATGRHFTAGDAADLTRVAGETFADPALLAQLGAAARAKWQVDMTPERNLEQLLAIYRTAIAA